jgi:uncharacterized protein (TIGR04255 family)
LLKNYEQFSNDYPNRKQLQQGRFGVQIVEGVAEALPVSHDLLGYRFEAGDGSQVVQFRTDGFTFSQLASYKDWETMVEQAHQMWARYLEVATPKEISRVGTRYINMMRFPLPFTELPEYLYDPPTVAPGQPGGLMSFLKRVVTHDEPTGETAIITQGIESFEEEHVPVILDIDAFVTTPFEPTDVDFWHCLSRLRETKNEIFFASITERAAELFE